MSNKDYQEMTEFFRERNLTVPSLFEHFADSVVRESEIARWWIGVPPETWPFASPGGSDDVPPNTSGSFTNFVSVGFTWHEPFDDIDGEYGDAVIDLRLVTREFLMEFRTSEGQRVLEGGGNGWNWTPESTWIPFWNEAMRDLNAFTAKVDLFAQFDNLSEAFTPEHASSFDATRRTTTTFAFADGAESVLRVRYLDGPPSLGGMFGDDDDGDDDDSDNDNIDDDDFLEFLEFLDSNELDDPPYFADYHQFIEHDENGLGWRLSRGSDISLFADSMQKSFATALDNPISPQLALSHEGHGTNGDGLNLHLQVGAVLIVVQYGWAGVGTGTSKQRATWNSGMDALHEFFNEIDLNVDIFAQPAPREIEVAIRYSDTRGSEARVRDAAGEWVDVDLSRCRNLQDVLDVVLEHEEDTWGLF